MRKRGSLIARAIVKDWRRAQKGKELAERNKKSEKEKNKYKEEKK